jgi:hypothetical protein
MVELNLYAVWAGILLGIIVGAAQGMFFHDEKWLGGYGTWRRRMVRLGHISLFGIAFINLVFVYTVNFFSITRCVRLPSYLLIIGAIAMPLVCYLSAFKKVFRHFFFIPVLSILAATVIFFIGGILL